MKQPLLSWAIRIGMAVLMISLPGSNVLAVVPHAAPPAASHTLYLPLVQYRFPLQTVFGVEMAYVANDRGLEMAVTSGTRWVRRNGLRWSDVEPVEDGGYHWSGGDLPILEHEMRAASQNNLNLVLTVRASPRWATAPYQADCAPIHPDKYANFARFLATAVSRYSYPPYNVMYWEIGNEPDTYIFPHDEVYGCWGVTDDPYYGGEAYGNMLNVVVPAMKAANPNIKILNGGLLLDQPYNPVDGSGRSGRFLEGVFRVGAGNAFDILSFHSYVYYAGSSDSLFGPKEDWRVEYLRKMMQQYNIPQKPLLRTESALLCKTLTTECRWAQADYVGRLYARAIRDNLLGNIWFIYDVDWYHNSALVEPGDVFVPRPAYYAFRHAATMMSAADYLGPLEDVPTTVEGYRLRKGADTVIILWSDAGQEVVLPIPTGATVNCTDRDGGAMECPSEGTGVRVNVGNSPIYIRYR